MAREAVPGSGAAAIAERLAGGPLGHPAALSDLSLSFRIASASRSQASTSACDHEMKLSSQTTHRGTR